MRTHGARPTPIGAGRYRFGAVRFRGGRLGKHHFRRRRFSRTAFCVREPPSRTPGIPRCHGVRPGGVDRRRGAGRYFRRGDRARERRRCPPALCLRRRRRRPSRRKIAMGRICDVGDGALARERELGSREARLPRRARRRLPPRRAAAFLTPTSNLGARRASKPRKSTPNMRARRKAFGRGVASLSGASRLSKRRLRRASRNRPLRNGRSPRRETARKSSMRASRTSVSLVRRPRS